VLQFNLHLLKGLFGYVHYTHMDIFQLVGLKKNEQRLSWC
jgi:hypothetical protein